MTLAEPPETKQNEGGGVGGSSDDFEALLDYLKRIRGFDFTGYKRASLMRRVDKEMQEAGVGTYTGYLDYLEVHPEGFERLFNTILINVTAFFRDGAAWDYLSSDVLPRILDAKADEEPIRIWSAGCASGQEPYSLAIALAEKLGIGALRDRVKIYATDVDDDALAQARAASFTPREVQGLSPELLAKYFDLEGGRYVFHRELRRALIFGRHDLLQDAPISRVDLLVCRNTMMYFNSEVQARILARFHFALRDGGFLFLGKAEMLFSHGTLFQPVDLKRRVFVKVPRGGLRERMLILAQAGPEAAGGEADNPLRLRETVFNAGPVAQIAVDADGMLILANDRARTLFRLGPRDVGRPLRDLEVSYRPVELRSCIEQATAEGRAVTVKDAPWAAPGGETTYLDVAVVPILDDGDLLGVSVSFSDVTRARQLSEELQESSRELETAYEELQSANEELETTNEELQSTVEELETTNEELQSTNEELETTNEELHSTNEELQTVNEELRVRSVALNHVNGYLESILTSLRGGVIVLDNDLRIQVWNTKSQDTWGLTSSEVQGKSLLTLDIGLPTEELIPAIRACLADQTIRWEGIVPAHNRRGKKVSCQVTVTPLVGLEKEVHGVILVTEEQPGAA